MSAQAMYPPGRYDSHWVRCLEWLAARPPGAKSVQILLDRGVTSKQLRYRQARIMSMVNSVKVFPGWSSNVKTMVADYTMRTSAIPQSDGTYHLYLCRWQSALTTSRLAALLKEKNDVQG
jgi:hypothetical protein